MDSCWPASGTQSATSTTANRVTKRRVMTVLAYPSPEDGSTGSRDFVTEVKSRSEVSRAGALRFILSLLLIENLNLWLGPTESFVDDFFWSWWRFEISVFDLVSVGSG